jgi:acetyltransferase-like isoleucine patch superfamily enzyme
MEGLELGRNITFWGKPLIDIRSGGKISIGDNTQLISTNVGTHVNYGVPTKLFVDRPGAQIVIGRNCSIGGACIHAYKSVVIGDNSLIGTGTNIIDANGHPVRLNQYGNRRMNIDEAESIVIENDVWITLNCVILPGSKIGQGSIVSANSVIHGIVPPNCIVAGNPATVIKKL